MTLVIKRKILELIKICEREPTLRDIVVEGKRDVSLLRWFCNESDAPEAKVYSIDMIDVPSLSSGQDSNEGGNRTRVIRLAAALKDVDPGRIRCIIDSDFDNLDIHLGDTPDHLHLIHLSRTHLPSMEVYLLNRKSLEKFAMLLADHSFDSIQVFIEEITVVLHALFCFRFVNRTFKLSWLEFERNCRTQGSRYVQFDIEGFSDRLLNHNLRKNEERSFCEALKKAFSQVPRDNKIASHGHDFVNLVYWVFRKQAIYTDNDPDRFQRTLFACLEHAELLNCPFWASVHAFLKN